MKALKIIFIALAFTSFQAQAGDAPAKPESGAAEAPAQADLWVPWQQHLNAPTLEEALALAKKGAEKGDAEAQYKLGLHYADGRGVTQDHKEAFKWFKKSAKKGNANGQFELGYLYETGKGVEKDQKEATYWYKKAAEQGNTHAAWRLDNVNAKAKLDAALSRKGTVISHVVGGGYSYIELNEKGKTVWISAPKIDTKEGDIVRFTEGSPMTNYYSKSLNRTFESVLFVGTAVVGDKE
ncbi:MAG: sel1 repeat family protein [Gallionellaceae bacterium]|nr:sel1 repeat family protein [Gallionellaceae bacterium]